MGRLSPFEWFLINVFSVIGLALVGLSLAEDVGATWETVLLLVLMVSGYFGATVLKSYGDAGAWNASTRAQALATSLELLYVLKHLAPATGLPDEYREAVETAYNMAEAEYQKTMPREWRKKQGG